MAYWYTASHHVEVYYNIESLNRYNLQTLYSFESLEGFKMFYKSPSVDLWSFLLFLGRGEAAGSLM